MPSKTIPIKRALLSCHDKAGLEVLAQGLAELGVELLASGGTAEFLTRHHVRVTTVEEFSGLRELLGGRVKTLHPKIHAGILARRDQPDDVASVGPEVWIDLVVVNLYPFARTIQRPHVSLEEAVEQIDIGGVALLRAAAKNFSHVAVVCDPPQYPSLLRALRDGKGRLPLEQSRALATRAFEVTTAYDRDIATFLSRTSTADGPEVTSLALRKRQSLRYGENPHQHAAWYLSVDGPAWGLGTLTQLQGKELSYNNLLDVDAALRCLLEFSEPTCAIIKHDSQCGLASAPTIQQAYEHAYACDTESAFGGIVGCNRPLGAAMATRLTETFLEVVVAPSVDPAAISVFGKKPNLRVVTLEWPTTIPATPEWRQLLGAWLRQDRDALTLHDGALQAVTTRAPTERERDDLLFAWKAAKHVKSNGIVLVSGRATVGLGQGQPSRVGSVRLAIEKAGARSRNAVAASDGFFPFPDGVELLAKAGVTAIIQPGGSIRDPDVVAAANAANVAMVVTSVRHFRH